MKAIPYRLELLEPMLVSQAESGEENSAIGLPFVPGSALRGAVVAHYLERYPTADLAADPQARQWFLDGTVCYLNAYPWDATEKARMLPTPKSWFTEKDRAGDDHGGLYDLAVDPDLAKRIESPKPPKDAAFCSLTGPEPPQDEDEEEISFAPPRLDRAACYLPPRQVNVHIALVETNRRGKDNKVFRYDALAAGEIMAGAIIASDDVDLTDLHTLLSDITELYIGGAHTAGYGRVRLEVDRIVNGWEEYPTADPPDNGEIVVTLLSDTLVRGRDGQINGDLDGALADLLGLPSLQAERRYQSARLVGGFNRKWGLPLPQAWALQAGSVYVYPAGAFDPDELRRKAALGLGERRAEGFGRIAVNWHTAPSVQRQPPVPMSRLRPKLSAESQALAQEMAQRRLRLRLERGLTDYLSGVTFKSLPPNTQLSRVRNAVQRALAEEKVDPVKEHLENLKGAKEQLKRARVNTDSLLDWIQARLDNLDVRQQLLSGGALPQIAGQEATLDDDLKRTYTLRLIDGVMQKATKEVSR
ncbi:MAG: CRISPR-associated RAMP protein Csx10 [Anaerolineae bacterium]